MATRKRAIVTRPRHQSQSWRDRLISSGLGVATIPALEIIPVSDAMAQQAVKNVILAIDEYAYLIFVSQNAVSYGFDWIEDYWPQFPQGVVCLAVGQKTLDAVNSRLAAFSSHFDATSSMMKMNSEELLESECLQNVADKKILIFRGVGGRTTLHETLTSRGATVNGCELYERRLPQDAVACFRQEKIRPDDDVLTIFSGESLENFHTLCGKENLENWQKLPVLVPSDRVATAAKAMGYEEIIVAQNATEDAMWESLSHWLDDK